MDNKGMVYGVAVFLACLLFGILFYQVSYFIIDRIYTSMFTGLNLTVQGSASLSVLMATWATIPAIIFFAAAWWLFGHIHRRQTV